MSEWIEWTGGECPVTEDVTVDVRLRCGEEICGERSYFFWWEHHKFSDDIIAYRIVKEKEE